MAFFGLFNSHSGISKQTIEAEKRSHESKIADCQRKIDGARQQIETLKEKNEFIKMKSKLSDGDKATIENNKKRMLDWKDQIERSKADIVREKEVWKKRLEYLKKNIAKE